MLRKTFYNATRRILFIRLSSNESIQITIPKRIKRDNLSILTALASTVKQDYSSPHYKYIDDPYFIPNSTHEKRVYSLSKVSGQDAAKYVSAEYPTSFEYDAAEPSIQALLSPVGPKLADNTLEGLKERILMKKCSLAHEAYTKCLNENIEIPTQDVEDLIDLLCFYNSQDPINDINPENLYLQHSLQHDKNKPNILRKSWNDSGAAARVFKNLEKPSLRSKCAMIKGRVKYLDMEVAFNEYLMIKEDNEIIDDVETYNSVLETIAYVMQTPEEKWNAINNVLKAMKTDNVVPNVGTFNTALRVLQTFKCSTMQKQMSMILCEMKKCKIEPSLCTWSLVLKISYFHRDIQNDILHKIVKYLSSKKIEILEPSDYDFFYLAMDIVLNNLKDLKLAYDLNHLIESSSSNLIGDGYKHSLYYTNFFDILTTYENVDEVMVYYNRLVPNTYDPTFKIMDSLFNLVEIQEGYKYIPKIYSDMVLMIYIKRKDLLSRLLSIMARKKQNDEQLQTVFAKIAENLMKLYEQEAANIRIMNKFELEGSHLGFIAIVLFNSGDLENSWNAINIYLTNKQKMIKFPSQKSLSLLCDGFIKEKQVDRTLKLVKLMEDLGFPTKNFVRRITDELPLNENQLKIIQNIQ